jgi:L-malate glycosyltransferase
MGHFYLLAHRFDQVVSVSRELAGHLIDDFGLPAGKVLVIHNGIAIPPLAGDRDKSGQMVIGSCGRLVAVKDYPLMIEVARELVRMTDNVRFMLAGEGPERARLEQMILHAGLANSFTLCGHIDDMARFYRQLDIFMNTSSHEGIPVSILEAMSHGVPVIAPRIGGIGEIIEDGVNGLLLDQRYPAAFAHATLQLLNDRSKRDDFAQAAKEKVARSFSAAAMAAEYRNLYLDLAARVKHRCDPAAAL